MRLFQAANNAVIKAQGRLTLPDQEAFDKLVTARSSAEQLEPASGLYFRCLNDACLHGKISLHHPLPHILGGVLQDMLMVRVSIAKR